jgi:flagellar basal body-associated protein FliL
MEKKKSTNIVPIILVVIALIGVAAYIGHHLLTNQM